jgi:hypothetical protein
LSFLPHGEDFRAAVFVRPDMNVCVQVLDRGMLQLQNIHGADVEAHIGWGAALHSNASKSVCRVSGPNGRQAAHGVTEGTGVLRYLGVKVSASSRFIEYWNEPKPEIDDPAVIRAIVLPLAAGGLNPPGRRRGDFGDPFL